MPNHSMRWCFALLMLMSAAAAQVDAPAGKPADRSFHLYATDGVHTLADGATLYVWGYSFLPEQGTATLPGPTLEVEEGELVEITLTNLGPGRAGVHPFPHTIHLHGLDVEQAHDGVPETSPSVRVGESFTYRFRATHAGTYWYHCHVETVEHLTMGMYGALVVHPTDGPGRAWTDGPPYDREYTLMLSESDPAWAAAVAENRPPDLRRFEPRYFFLNGRSFPETMDYPDTHIVGHLGDRVLVRLVNAGYGWRSMHMHGFHFEVVASDGRPLPQPYLKDTLSIAPGERYDILVTLDQLGSYPFHSHVLLDNLNDGAYPGGIHTMVTVRPPRASLDIAGHDGHAVLPAPASSPSPAGPPPPATGSRTGLAAVGGFPIRRPLVDAAAHDLHVAQATAPPAGATVVEMRGDRFYPEHLVIEVGTTVAWVNADPRTHALATNTFASPDIPRSRTWAYTFDAPGVYVIECVNHRGMQSVVTVR